MKNTEILRVGYPFSEKDEEILRRAGKIIRDGGLVIFPTETVYGLGADATNADGARAIYAAKGRPADNPLIIHIAKPDDAEKYTETNETYYKLANAFMPGPLTVVLKSKPTIPDSTRASLPTVAVRCPSDPIAHRLIAEAGVPIAAPSANLSGSPSPTSAGHVADDMMGRVDMILDGGECDIGLESTIVKIEDDGALVLLRPGRITPEELSSVAPLSIASAVTAELKEGEVALSPGMKYRHYAPKAPVVLLDGTPEQAIAYIKREINGKSYTRVAVLVYDGEEPVFRKEIPGVTLFPFGEKGNEEAQAHRLFYLLREADKENFDAIFAPLPGQTGFGLALYNRMIRAAAHHIVTL